MAVSLPDRLPFQTWDVFTDTRFSGNPLAIVDQADGLDPARMQVLAREFNLSETFFVQTPDDPGHSAKVRIFFPTAEIPFAGHPTIGCAIYLATRAAPGGDFETEVTLEEQAGLVPVRVWRRGGSVQAEFVAPVLPHAPAAGAVPEPAALARACGLAPEQVGFGNHAPGLWQGGPAFLYIPVADPDALAMARPQEPAWSDALQAAGVDSAYLYTPQGGGYRTRMFSPTAGIPEDPATGSASAILAAQLLASGALPEGETRVALQQGVEMGRPSRIGLTVVVTAGAVAQVRVAGSAVPVSEGRIALPNRP